MWKTTSGSQSKTVIDLRYEETQEQYIQLTKASPDFFLQQGERPLLINEKKEISFI
jgi:hypothetical protein